jgi:RND family efflux transporter MFP subunit
MGEQMRRAILVVSAIAIAACHRQSPPPPPAPVVSFTVHAAAGEGDSLPYPVEVQARYSNALSFRVGGKLIERRVRLGDAVHQGEIVARLDASDAQKQAASARAALAAAEHRLQYAKQQLDRDQAQFAAQLIAENQLEQTEDAYSTALAARDQAADQQVIAENTRRYHALVADHDGLITSENADTGQVVSAGQAIYGLAWSDATDAVLDAAASDVSRMRVGQAATVTFPSLEGRSFPAKVREVAPAADPASRTYRVKLTLEDPASDVRLGMTGDATLAPATSGRSDSRFSIPATALFHQDKDPAVWLVRGNEIELKPVQVAKYGERAVIVAGGLSEGDVIVAAGVHTVFAGERVKPVKPLFADDNAGGGPGTKP